ncbi:MAG TPA: J domain-containing protein [Bryobacteraceae bacterium]
MLLHAVVPSTMDENLEKHYQVLNLDPTASPEEVYQAYRDLARVWDPQRFAHSPRLEMKAEEKLSEIIAAYRALLPAGPPGAAQGMGFPAIALSSADPEPVALPRDPFAAPEPQPRMIADLHRPVDLPRAEPAQVRPVILPEAQIPPATPATPGIWNPAPAPTAAAPDEPAPPAVDPAATRRSRRLEMAAAAVTGFVVVGGAMFLYQAMSSPPPGTTQPGPAPAAALTVGSPAAGDTAGSRPDAVPAPRSPDAHATRKAARRNAVPEQQPRPYATGTELIEPEGRAGAGLFRIANRSGEDAVARVSSQTAPETALRLVYVRAGTEVNLGNIGPGVYFVSFSMGPVTPKPRKFGTRFGPFQFVQIQSTNGYQSDQYRVVLKPRP